MNTLESIGTASLNQFLTEVASAGGGLSVKIYSGALPSSISTPTGTLLIDFIIVSPTLAISNVSITLPTTTATAIEAGNATIYTIQDQSGRNLWQDYIGAGIVDPAILVGDLVQLNLTIRA